MGRRIRFQKLNNQKRVGNGGFSLLEVIISMAILALITIPLLNYFTNSMSNSARMGKRQNATLTAQEITESLKAEDKLIQRMELLDGNIVYQVPYLTDELGFTLADDSGFNQTDGTGKIVFGTTNDLFDVRVTLSTNISANSVERALVYGIDDATDMLIIEQDQMDEALVYFTSAHVTYCANHPEAAVLSKDDIKSRLERWICIDISYSAGKYTVRAYYDYITTDASVTGAAGQHLVAGKSFSSSYLTEAKVTTLKNIYLLYDLISGSFVDTVNITLDGLPTDFSGVDLYLLCQNLPDEETGPSYTLNFGGDSNPKLKFHANTRDSDSVNTSLAPMTQTGAPIRMIEIITEVYEKGLADSGEDPLAAMRTTKGE